MKSNWILIVVVLAACSKDDTAGVTPSSMAAATKDGTSPRDAVFGAWKSGGLAVSPFEIAKTQVGQDCTRGKVASLDVLVCTYGSSDAAKTAEAAAYRWVGDTTGAAQTRGSLLIAVADRAKSDPNGKTINQVMKLAPK
jgi:hypothetical protein